MNAQLYIHINNIQEQMVTSIQQILMDISEYIHYHQNNNGQYMFMHELLK